MDISIRDKIENKIIINKIKNNKIGIRDIANMLCQNQWQILDFLDETKKIEATKFASAELLSSYHASIYPGYTSEPCIYVDFAIKHFPQALKKNEEFVDKYWVIYPQLEIDMLKEKISNIDYVTKVITRSAPVKDRKTYERLKQITELIPQEYWSNENFISTILKKDSDIIDYIPKEIMEKHWLNENLTLDIIASQPKLIERIPYNIMTESLSKKIIELNIDNFKYLREEKIEPLKMLYLQYIDKNIENIDYTMKSNIESFIRNDEAFAIEIINRGLMNYVSNINKDLRQSPNIINTIVKKLKEYGLDETFRLDEMAKDPAKILNMIEHDDIIPIMKAAQRKINIQNAQGFCISN